MAETGRNASFTKKIMATRTKSRIKLWVKRGVSTRDALKVKASPQEWEEVSIQAPDTPSVTMTNVFIRNFIRC